MWRKGGGKQKVQRPSGKVIHLDQLEIQNLLTVGFPIVALTLWPGKKSSFSPATTTRHLKVFTSYDFN
jgi:hypothetical protein